MLEVYERIRSIPNSYVSERFTVYSPLPHQVLASTEQEVKDQINYMDYHGLVNSLSVLTDNDGEPMVVWWNEIYHSWNVWYQETFIDPFCGTNEFRYVDDWRDSDTGETGRKDIDVDDIMSANVVTSRIVGYVDEHKPVLDIDVPEIGEFLKKIYAEGTNIVIKSSTPGHYHVFIDKPMPWEEYCHWMECLSVLGILEEGFVNASKARGYSAARLPWVTKTY